MEPRVSKRSSKTQRKSLYSDGDKYTNNILNVDFNSETLSSSSPVKPDITEKPKVRRKKIRSTQDFNQLNVSITSEESNISTKYKAQKTRKIKGVYALPKITNLIEDAFGGKENKPSKRESPRKQMHLTPHKTRKSTKEIKTSSNESLGEQYQSATSTISDDEGDSEIEIELKGKFEAKNNSRMRTRNDKYYATRIKRMLLNASESSPEENPENSNFQSLQQAPKKLDTSKFTEKTKNTNNKSMQQINNIGNYVNGFGSDSILKDEGKKHNLVRLDANFSSDVTNESNEQGKYVRRRVDINNARKNHGTKNEMSKRSGQYVEIKNANEQSDCEHILAGSDIVQQKTSKRSYNLSLDDDVFDIIIDKKSDQNIHLDKSESKNTTRKLVRKSVHFASEISAQEETNIRRSTYDIDKCKESINLFRREVFSDADGVLNDVESPINTEEKFFIKDINTQKSLLGDSMVEKDLLNETFEVKSPNRLSINKLIGYSVEMLSPMAKSKNKNSCKCTETPKGKSSLLGKTVSKSTKSNSGNSNVISSAASISHIKDTIHLKQNNLHNDLSSNCTIHVTTPYKKNVCEGSIVISSTSSNKKKSQQYLTKPCEMFADTSAIIQEKNLQTMTETWGDNILHERELNEGHENLTLKKSHSEGDNMYGEIVSPKIQSTTGFMHTPSAYNSSNKLIDTSKVTKRKQWDKSRLSISFLDSSLDIGNISAPWKEGMLNNTFEKSNTEVSQLFKVNEATKVYKKGMSPPSSTSTPLSVRKNSLLKEKSVSMNEGRSLNKSSNRAVGKSTRTKMPNFALIHQRAYDKLESLKEMSERKAHRAKLLLSGCKPDNLNGSSKSKKFLQFSPAKPKQTLLATPTNLDENGKLLKMSNISVFKVKNISPSKSNPKVIAKDKLTPIEKKKGVVKTKSNIPTRIPNNVTVERKGFTRYGFKVGSKDMKNTTKEEQVKAVAAKTKIIKNSVEERRNVIQGVRSNRRFELLMSLRNK